MHSACIFWSCVLKSLVDGSVDYMVNRFTIVHECQNVCGWIMPNYVNSSKPCPFWMAVTPLSSILFVLIQEFVKENANNEICLIWGVTSSFITLMLVVITLEVIGQRLRSYKVGSFGPLCFLMLIDFAFLVSVVNVHKCPVSSWYDAPFSDYDC